MRKTPSKVARRPITQHNAFESPQRSSAVTAAGRPGTVLTQHVRFQVVTSPFSPKTLVETETKAQEDKSPEVSVELPSSKQGRDSLSASPMLGKYRKKYEIENHSYLGIPGSSVFAGVLQRDEASILKEKKAQQQQEVKAALQLQILEKQRRLEAERFELLRAEQELAAEADIQQQTEGEKHADPQSGGGEVQSGTVERRSELPEEEPDIHNLYTEILKEHESLKAKVESQEAWIQQLVYHSIGQTRERSPSLKKPSAKLRGKKVQVFSANQRRAHSSAAGLPVGSAKPQSKRSDFSLFLEENSAALKGGNSIPVTSTATPVHKIPERNLDAGGSSMFLYPSAKGVFEERLRSFPTEDIRNRRETSVPRQRREKTPNLRFPKDVSYSPSPYLR